MRPLGFDLNVTERQFMRRRVRRIHHGHTACGENKGKAREKASCAHHIPAPVLMPKTIQPIILFYQYEQRVAVIFFHSKIKLTGHGKSYILITVIKINLVKNKNHFYLQTFH